MDIFPGLLGETEFRMFTETDYACLHSVLDDTLAKYILDYMCSENADQEIVGSIQKNIGKIVESMTFHLQMRDKGIIDLLKGLSPESIVSLDADSAKDVREKLTFLEDNVDKVRLNIQPRSKKSWEDFYSAMQALHIRMLQSGIRPTYDDMLERLKSNSFIFYVPGDKGHSTGMGLINSRRNQWTICLRGLEYKDYCDSKNINYLERRVF